MAEQQIERQGFVTHIVFRNEDNGYTVFEILSEGETLTCTGYPAAIAEGEGCVIRGVLTRHPVYGEQLKIESYTARAPEDAEAMFRYLSSGVIRGIGAALAERIVKAFGDDTLRILEEEPERLSEVRGISERGAREIAAQLEGKRELQGALLAMQRYGITSRQALRIYKAYGEGYLAVLQQDPYRLAEDIEGIGFRQADDIAQALGLQRDSAFRVRSALRHALRGGMEEGNSYLPYPELMRRTRSLLGEDVPTALLETELSNLTVEGSVRQLQKAEARHVYSAFAFEREKRIAGMLCRLRDYLPEKPLRAEAVAEVRVEDTAPDEWQAEALRQTVDHTVLVISGGPGTGKTTTIRSLLQFFLRHHLEVALAAPTGRAAKRMENLTGYEALTLHRLLGVRPVGEEEAGTLQRAAFDHDEENPLMADAIIIDEMSMVDMHLFYALLRAVRPGTRLILVGDVDQLPSVGPGCVLRDLIRSEAFATIRLQTIFRQEAKSDIIANAHRILRGEPLRLDNKSKDFFFLERRDAEVIYKHLVELLRDRLPGYLHCRTEDIQVLTPMRKGSLGVERLNEVLQSVLNPPDPRRREVRRGETIFREGDKVMQTRNNYQLHWEIPGRFGIAIDSGDGVFNGDAGRILEIDRASETVTVLFEEERQVRYERADLDDLEPAYAVTVHKAQGSEYPAVLLPLLSGPAPLMNRNLLYTAVTRARQAVIILGSRECLEEMEANRNETLRFTGLEDRIRELA